MREALGLDETEEVNRAWAVNEREAFNLPDCNFLYRTEKWRKAP